MKLDTQKSGPVRKLGRESLWVPGGGLPRAAAGAPRGEAVGAVQGGETRVPTGSAAKSAWAPGPASVPVSLVVVTVPQPPGSIISFHPAPLISDF